MIIKENIAISESGFLFNANTGDSFNLNNTGKIIVSMLKEGKTEKEISNYFIEKYDVEESVFEHNFIDFLNMLKHMNLIETNE